MNLTVYCDARDCVYNKGTVCTGEGWKMQIHISSQGGNPECASFQGEKPMEEDSAGWK